MLGLILLTRCELVVALCQCLELKDVEGVLSAVHPAGEHLYLVLLSEIVVLPRVVAGLLDLVIDLLELF